MSSPRNEENLEEQEVSLVPASPSNDRENTSPSQQQHHGEYDERARAPPRSREQQYDEYDNHPPSRHRRHHDDRRMSPRDERSPPPSRRRSPSSEKQYSLRELDRRAPPPPRAEDRVPAPPRGGADYYRDESPSHYRRRRPDSYDRHSPRSHRAPSRDRFERRRYRGSRDRRDYHHPDHDVRRPPPKSPGFSIYVRNIDDSVRDTELRELFEQYGVVRDVYIPRDYHTKRRKNFAYVEMDAEHDRKEAIDKIDQTELAGRVLTVAVAKGKRKSRDEMRRNDRKPRYYPPPPRGRSRYDRYDDRYRPRRDYDDYHSRRGYDREYPSGGGRYRSRSPYSRRDSPPRKRSPPPQDHPEPKRRRVGSPPPAH